MPNQRLGWLQVNKLTRTALAPSLCFIYRSIRSNYTITVKQKGLSFPSKKNYWKYNKKLLIWPQDDLKKVIYESKKVNAASAASQDDTAAIMRICLPSCSDDSFKFSLYRKKNWNRRPKRNHFCGTDIIKMRLHARYFLFWAPAHHQHRTRLTRETLSPVVTRTAVWGPGNEPADSDTQPAHWSISCGSHWSPTHTARLVLMTSENAPRPCLCRQRVARTTLGECTDNCLRLPHVRGVVRAERKGGVGL